MSAIPPANGTPPTRDGQVQVYETPQKPGVREWYDPHARAIFINGQSNDGASHLASARAVSLLYMRPVIGVFNATGGLLRDTAQSAGDKLQFAHDPAAYFARHLADLKKRDGREPDRLSAMTALLARNPATLSTFELLRSGTVTTSVPLIAHSQGNLILSNALFAVSLIDGPGAVRDLSVVSFGSPARQWPAGIRRVNNAFTGDMVSLLDLRIDVTTAKVGLRSDAGPLGFFAHSFLLYLKDDARFLVNYYRWGGWGVTLSMNEDGLATALASMGNNEPRLRAVFELLNKHHNSDADDVALLYVQKMRATPAGAAALRSMKNAPLVPLLVRVMDEGWTTSAEKDAIAYLRAL